MKIFKQIGLLFTISIVSLFLFPLSQSIAQTENLSPTLERGIGLYKHENYEEALPLLIKAREEEPQSTLAAYYLGLNYKQLQNYRQAIPHLRDAVTNIPKIKGALIELIDCLYNYDRLEEAKKWVKEAETEGIRPAQVSFLKGLVLIKEGKYEEAIVALEDAKARDKSMEQASDYQIGIAHLKAKEVDKAQDAFHDVVDILPSSNLAQYAQEYLDALSKQKEAFRPWKLSFTTAWQYDDNVVLKPEDSAAATNIADEADWRTVYNTQVEYTHRFDERLALKGQYNFYYGKQNDLGFYDTMSHSILLQPGIYSADSLLAFPTAYNHTLVDERSYLSNPSTGVLYNKLFGASQMGQGTLRYNYKDFLWTPSISDEDRDGNEISAGLGWFWFFAEKKGYWNLRYGYDNDWTKGQNWDYQGHRLNAAVLAPVTEKFNVSLAGSAFFQNFENTHTVYGLKRDDDVYTASVLAAYQFYKDSEFQLQYTYVKDNSNIDIYQYDRNIYSVGVQMKF